jgi:hypothetical protein
VDESWSSELFDADESLWLSTGGGVLPPPPSSVIGTPDALPVDDVDAGSAARNSLDDSTDSDDALDDADPGSVARRSRAAFTEAGDSDAWR